MFILLQPGDTKINIKGETSRDKNIIIIYTAFYIIHVHIWQYNQGIFIKLCMESTQNISFLQLLKTSLFRDCNNIYFVLLHLFVVL